SHGGGASLASRTSRESNRLRLTTVMRLVDPSGVRSGGSRLPSQGRRCVTTDGGGRRETSSRVPAGDICSVNGPVPHVVERTITWNSLHQAPPSTRPPSGIFSGVLKYSSAWSCVSVSGTFVLYVSCSFIF